MDDINNVRALQARLAQETKRRMDAEQKLQVVELQSSSRPGFRGANKTKKAEKTSYDHALIGNLLGEMKEKVFPDTKFPPPNLDEFTPNQPGTFCHAIADAIDMPPDCVPSIYYKERVVPQVNIMFQNWRSNAAQIAGRKPFLGELFRN